MPTLLARLSQITYLPPLNSRHSEIRLKTSTSNLNPIIWRRTIWRRSLSKSHDSAVGPDDIHYQTLQHFPPNAVNTLLQTLNNIWLAGNFPPSWRTSTVIPIPKPAKDASDPNNYRPIALTSCLCKVIERMACSVSRKKSTRNSSLFLSQTTKHYRPPRTFRIFY